MELFRQLGNRQTNRQTDKQTDGLTELFLKSLSRLKTINLVLPCLTFFEVPALYKSILLFLWQSAIPIIVFYNIFAFRKFAVTKIKSYIDEIKGRFEFHLQKLKLRNNSVGISPSEVQRHFDT